MDRLQAIGSASDVLERRAATTPVTVLVADDSQLIRRAICRLLRERVEIEIVGEALGYAQSVRMASDLRPQVIVMDLHLACRDGVTPLDVREQLNHGSRLLVVSIANDEEAKTLAERFGAVMLVDKMTLFHELIPPIL